MKKAAFFIALLCVFGCGGASNLFNENRPTVRIVNVITGPSVNAFVQDAGGQVTYLFGQGFASAGVNRISAGTRDVTITDSSNNTILLNTSETFADDQSYTIVAYGTPGAVQSKNLNENFTPSAGNAAVRVLQAGGTGTPLVDIYTGAPGSDVANAALYRNDLATGNTMVYQDVPAGTTKFFFTDPTNSANVLVSDDIDFVAGKHYTLIVAPNGTLQLVTVTED